VSRKLAKPLAVIVQSTSAAGKSTLMDAVLAFFPEEERIKYSAMTGQSLYYLGEANLKHKILAIVEEEGAEKASYALKLLQSEGELTIASTGKDPNTGRMETQEYHVQGPVMIFLTTTTIDIDDELLNRCLVLSVDESAAQTARIHERQRQARTLEGLLEREARKDVLALWRDAQRLIRPLGVVNPFAGALTFTSERTRTRRDHEKYLTLIDSIALLHQHQREVKTRTVNERSVEYIEVQLTDIETANALAPEILGRSLDELPPQTRRLLNHIRELVRAMMEKTKAPQGRCLFSRRELCERCGWTYAQVRTHLERLIEVEMVATRAGKHGATMLYELLMEAAAPETTWQIGLIDTSKLKKP
jgi:post-segregation antitoxin (ccd killing protein)